MAITKIYAIRDRLDKRVAYAANEQKTSLHGMIEYAVNELKTEERLFQSVINCECVDTAFDEMRATKRRWKKENGVLGYHFIQSFAPGEVTPDKAHQIGIEFAQRCFGDRFEVVIGTHLDKNHLHNHIIVNSVSCVDGRKYHSSPESYYNKIRTTSDQLCIENKLSVIEIPHGYGKHYAEWQAEREGKPTVRSPIREDIDRAISQSLAPSQFYAALREMGYEIKFEAKYPAVRPPGKERYFRLKSLGEDYTLEAIHRRILEQTYIKMLEPKKRSYSTRKPPSKTYLFIGTFGTRAKITGLRALYYHYLYKMGILPQRVRKNDVATGASAKRTHFLLREELRNLDRITAETKFLCTYHIYTAEQLKAHHASAETEIKKITNHRKRLRYRLRSINDESEAEECKIKIAEISRRISDLRKEVKYCAGILSRSEDIGETLLKVKKEEINEKEMKQHEHKRGRGRSSR